MKKSIIGMMILSLLFVASAQNSLAKGENGKVGVKQEKSIKGKKHLNAKRDRAQHHEGNVGKNKRLEGKEKAIQKRQDGKEKAIERRLQGKQNAIESRSQNTVKKGHKGHGKHKRNINNANNPHHINRGKAIQSHNNAKQAKHKKFIKQNNLKNGK